MGVTGSRWEQIGAVGTRRMISQEKEKEKEEE